METKEMYKFICGIALEFRLSLKNICKILGWDPTEENKMKFYNIVEDIYGAKSYDIKKYKYLFFYETYDESENASRVSLTVALNFLNRYNNAIKSGDKDKIKEIISELHRTDDNLKKITDELREGVITPKTAEIITKYRIKYLIPRERFCKDYNISRDTLQKREREMESKILQEKNKKLLEYYFDIINSKGFIKRSSAKRKK